MAVTNELNPSCRVDQERLVEEQLAAARQQQVRGYESLSPIFHVRAPLVIRC